MIKKIIISILISYTFSLGLSSPYVRANDVRKVDYHPSIRTFNIYIDRLAMYDNWKTWIENYLNKVNEDLIEKDTDQQVEEENEIDEQPEPRNEVPEKEVTQEPKPEPIEPPEKKEEPIEPKPDDPKPKAPAPDKSVDPTPPKPKPKPKPVPGKEEPIEEVNTNISAFEQRVVKLTNEERTARGLEPLVLDQSLSAVAKEKSADMARNNYFNHTSPTYGSPFDMMKQFNIKYRAAGENIAQGQQSPEQVVEAWMNSDGHRANILNANFTHIGVGHAEDNNYWTQMFIGK